MLLGLAVARNGNGREHQERGEAGDCECDEDHGAKGLRVMVNAHPPGLTCRGDYRQDSSSQL